MSVGAPAGVCSREWLGGLCGDATGSRGVNREVSQSVSYFTVPPRVHPSTGSQSGSAAPGLTQCTEYSLPGATQFTIVARQVRSISPSVNTSGRGFCGLYSRYFSKRLQGSTLTFATQFHIVRALYRYYERVESTSLLTPLTPLMDLFDNALDRGLDLTPRPLAKERLLDPDALQRPRHLVVTR